MSPTKLCLIIRTFTLCGQVLNYKPKTHSELSHCCLYYRHIIVFHRCCSKVCFSFTESGYVDFSVYRYTKLYIRIRKNDIHSLRLSILLLHTTLPFSRYLVIMLEYASGSNSASRQFPLLSGISAIRCESACFASKRDISSSDTM